MASPLAFDRAAVLCYRLFDIADSIDLERGRTLLAERTTRRQRLTREGSEYLVLPNPPLVAEVGQRPLGLRAGPVQVQVTARFFDHGAASVLVEVPIPEGTPIESILAQVDELSDTPALDALAKEVLTPLREALGPALEDGHLWSESESYTVVFAERMRGSPTAAEVLQNEYLPVLVLGDAQSQPLSALERRDVLEQHFSYTERDLAVIDWNVAFVYEPSGSRDIPDLLEIANAQLLELRYYDDFLDTQLSTTYREMSRRSRRWNSIVRSPYRSTARRLLLTLIELSEFVERVENSLKIIGDFYLAKVYEGALRQLRIHAWQDSVTRKQELLAQTYELLKGEIDTDRVLTLDVMIVLLIVVEVVLALWRPH
jgi:hypothetical protein